MNRENILRATYTPGELSRIRFYYNQFVTLYNLHRVDKHIDELKFMRILNVEIMSFKARWPDEGFLSNEAAARFRRALKEARELQRKQKGIKSYGPRSTPPR